MTEEDKQTTHSEPQPEQLQRDLSESLRKSANTVDLGDVISTGGPINLNPMQSAPRPTSSGSESDDKKSNK